MITLAAYITAEIKVKQQCFIKNVCRMFDTYMFLSILGNSLVLATFDYSDDQNTTLWNQILDKIDTAFTALYTLEAIVKILAFGFVLHKKSYLRNPWNILDFTVVITGILSMIPNVPNLKSLRVMRVLRPLRSINAAPSMRRLVQTLLTSLPQMGYLIMFVIYFIAIFSIVGIHLFQRDLYQRCRLTDEPISINGILQWPYDDSQQAVCGGAYQCNPGTYCHSLKERDIPLDLDKPGTWDFTQWGYFSFDNIGVAILSVFRVMCVQGWSTVMYMYYDSTGMEAFIYFPILVVCGAFFILNLFLAVIMSTFRKIAKEKTDTEENEENNNNIASPENANHNRLSAQEHSDEVFGNLNPKTGALQNSQPTKSNLNRNFFHTLCTSNMFKLTIMVVIVINTICLSMDSYPINTDLQQRLDTLNVIFFSVFVAEMLIKIIGLGPKEYLKDQFNIFDALIVSLSVVDVILDYILPQDRANSSRKILMVFRSFRLLRVFKLAKSLSKLHILIKTFLRSLKNIASFCILLVLLIFIYLLIGLQIFAVPMTDQASPDFIVPRHNFLTFYNGFIVIYVFLTGDSWDDTMFRFANQFGWIAIYYFVSIVLIGQLIFLSLLLAMILDNFDVSDLEKVTDEQTMVANTVTHFYLFRKCQEGFKAFSYHFNRMIAQLECKEDTSKNGLKSIEENQELQHLIGTSDRNQQQIDNREINVQDVDHVNGIGESPHTDLEGGYRLKGKRKMLSTLDHAQQPFALMKLQQQMKTTSNLKLSILGESIHCQGNSFFIMNSTNQFRIKTETLVNSNYFQSFILFLIVLSSIMLALDNPLLDPNSILNLFFKYEDIVLTSFFIFEALCKMIVSGLIFNGSGSYLRSGWNIIDISVVLISIISITIQNPTLQTIKVLRLLRVIRPLRVISRNKGLKIGIQALFMAVPSLINMTFVTMFFFVIFGTFGVNYLKGTYFYCSMGDLEPSDLQSKVNNYVKTKWDCLDYGGDWINADQNFDTIGQAMLTLFQITTAQNWSTMMENAMDMVGIDMQPQFNINLYWSVYYMILIMAGRFLILNLFVGVVVSTFNREKEILGKNFLLTETQKKWLEQKRLYMKVQPIRRFDDKTNLCREKIRRVVTSRQFENFIIGCIVLNTVVLCLAWYDQTNEQALIVDYLNYAFALIFLFEAILKIIAMGPKLYFIDSGNQFDFLIVVVSVSTSLVSIITGTEFGAKSNFIRAIRLLNALKHLKRAHHIKALFETIIITLPAICNIGGLLILFLFIYAVLGMNLFATLKLQDYLDRHANFQTFGLSFLTLLKCATGENWDYVMMDMARPNQIQFQCDQGEFDYQTYLTNGMQTQGCGSQMAIFYFVSFYLFVPIIFLNLFIAIILSGFDQTSEILESVITDADLQHFRECWAQFDRRGTGFIKISLMPQLLFSLGAPLGLEESEYKGNQRLLDNFMEELNIQTCNEFKDYFFYEVLQGLIKVQIINEDLKKVLYPQQDNHFRIDQERFKRAAGFAQKKLSLRLELDFEKLDHNLNEVMDVQDIHRREQRIKSSFLHKEDLNFTSAHVKAAHMILRTMRKFKSKRDLLKNSEFNEHLLGDTKGLQRQDSCLPATSSLIEMPETQEWSSRQINHQHLRVKEEHKHDEDYRSSIELVPIKEESYEDQRQLNDDSFFQKTEPINQKRDQQN